MRSLADLFFTGDFCGVADTSDDPASSRGANLEEEGINILIGKILRQNGTAHFCHISRTYAHFYERKLFEMQ